MASKGSKSSGTNTRSSITGQYVKPNDGRRSPNTTEVERRKPRK